MSGEAFLDKDWDCPPASPPSVSTSSSTQPSPSVSPDDGNIHPTDAKTTPKLEPSDASSTDSSQKPNNPENALDSRLPTHNTSSMRSPETPFHRIASSPTSIPSQILPELSHFNSTNSFAPLSLNVLPPVSLSSFPPSRISNLPESQIPFGSNSQLPNGHQFRSTASSFYNNPVSAAAANWQNLLASSSLARNLYCNYQSLFPAANSNVLQQPLTPARGLPPLFPPISHLPIFNQSQHSMNGVGAFPEVVKKPRLDNNLTVKVESVAPSEQKDVSKSNDEKVLSTESSPKEFLFEELLESYSRTSALRNIFKVIFQQFDAQMPGNVKPTDVEEMLEELKNLVKKHQVIFFKSL